MKIYYIDGNKGCGKDTIIAGISTLRPTIGTSHIIDTYTEKLLLPLYSKKDKIFNKMRQQKYSSNKMIKYIETLIVIESKIMNIIQTSHLNQLQPFFISKDIRSINLTSTIEFLYNRSLYTQFLYNDLTIQNWINVLASIKSASDYFNKKHSSKLMIEVFMELVSKVEDSIQLNIINYFKSYVNDILMSNYMRITKSCTNWITFYKYNIVYITSLNDSYKKLESIVDNRTRTGFRSIEDKNWMNDILNERYCVFGKVLLQMQYASSDMSCLQYPCVSNDKAKVIYKAYCFDTNNKDRLDYGSLAEDLFNHLITSTKVYLINFNKSRRPSNSYVVDMIMNDSFDNRNHYYTLDKEREKENKDASKKTKHNTTRHRSNSKKSTKNGNDQSGVESDK